MVQKIRNDQNLGSNIRKLRKNSHMTQAEVVRNLQLKGLDISRSAYAQIECGTYNIRVNELAALKKLFRAEYADFFAGIDEDES